VSRLDAVGIAGQAGSGPNFMGAKKTAMEFFPPVEEASPGPNFQEMEASETIGSRFPTDREIGGIYYEPSASGKVRNTWLPRMLSTFMCDPVTTQLAPGVFQHVLEPSDPAAVGPRAQSVLIHRGDPTPPITDLYWDALGQELSCTVEPNDWLAFESSWIAANLDETQPPPVVVQDLTRRFPFYTVCAYLGEPPVALPLGQFGFTWSSNIDTDAWALCKRGLWRVAPGNVDLEVTFSPLDKLKDFYRAAFAVEADPVEDLKVVAEGPLIDATNKHSVTFEIARIIETEVEADVNAEEVLLSVPVTGQASLDPATGDFIRVTVVNTVPSYAVT
jgi:hypothetical protein